MISSDRWEWSRFAACADQPATMHPVDALGEDVAKKVCSGCPVQERCLGYALEHREPYGVWGGLSEHERRVAYRRRFGQEMLG